MPSRPVKAVPDSSPSSALSASSWTLPRPAEAGDWHRRPSARLLQKPAGRRKIRKTEGKHRARKTKLRSVRGCHEGCFRLPDTRAVIWPAAPAPAPALQDPRCQVPAASSQASCRKRNTVGLRRPGSAPYNSVLCPELPVGPVTGAAITGPFPPGRWQRPRQSLPHPSRQPRTPLLLCLVRRARKKKTPALSWRGPSPSPNQTRSGLFSGLFSSAARHSVLLALTRPL